MKGLAGGFPLRCCIALAALAMNALALNLFVVPSTGSYPSYGGFAAALAAVLAYAALLAVAARRPDALLRPSVPWAGLALFCAGSALVAAGTGANRRPPRSRGGSWQCSPRRGSRF